MFINVDVKWLLLEKFELIEAKAESPVARFVVMLSQAIIFLQ